MLFLLRRLLSLSEYALLVPTLIIRFLLDKIAFNPRLGPVRYAALGAIGYAAFAILLVYVVAPIRGYVGQLAMSDKLQYDAERWLATAIYDAKGDFAGTFDPRLDSLRDVNYTGSNIEVGDYTASPDHKSIPVRETPPSYWQCLLYHEDRYLGSALNPFGIDLLGVLKIPFSTVRRSLLLGRPALGVGGSTLPMQFARVIYKTPPDASEGAFTKFKRKLGEWWLAPVIYFELTQGGDDTRLKQWAANHIWLAQRTGGSPLHGVEVTSRIVFGKEAKDLSIAEQFVLASAVNKPIILLEGSDKLNEVRLDRWQYITEVRARTCAEKLITDEALKKDVIFELLALAGGPPDPKVKPRLQAALDRYAPLLAERARANPEIRSNALLPAARFGIREEMKQVYGFSWRDYVRGVRTTIDAVDNLALRQKLSTKLALLDTQNAANIYPAFTLDPAKAGADKHNPDVIVVAANAAGDIVRYYEIGETASYFGSPGARSSVTGVYDPAHETRMIASTGKMLAGIGIANEGRDRPETLYLDTDAPARGLETCAKGGGQRRGRQALVTFACSLNNPLISRTALLGQGRVKSLVDAFGFVMPPAGPDGSGTPPSTAVVLGQISGSPRRVHHMASVVLNALINRGRQPAKMPSLVKSFDYTARTDGWSDAIVSADTASIVPDKVIKRGAHPFLKTLLESPLCYRNNGVSYGTLKSLDAWCAGRRSNVRLHFAKTGTQVTADPNATVDVWIAGGLQFTNGAAYSYVVLVGTGSALEPWANSLHAAQVAAPLLDTLLQDLEADAKRNPAPSLLPPAPKPAAPVASLDGTPDRRKANVSASPADLIARNLVR